jgi:hypothetical protein
MADRLTAWEGRDADGPRAVMLDRDSPFCEAFQAILRKLARHEDDLETRSAQSAIMSSAIMAYGAQAQELMLLEEMSELQKEICKYERGAENVQHIAEEIADVEIMLEQMKILFECAEAVSAFRKAKLDRLRRRIEGGDHDG